MGNSLLTGQREEAGIGLYYYGALWYDPGLARFIQPDTIVSNPGDAQSFDRYAYVNNNPLKYTDPSGHCANIFSDPDSVDYDNADCWRLANTMMNMWDDTDYWRNRFGTQENFRKYVASVEANGPDFFQSQLDIFSNSDEGKTWRQRIPIVQRPEQDLGDYTAINFSAGFLGGALIIDDYGNVYFRSDNSFVGSSGLSLTRGDILLHQGGLTWTDIDQLGFTPKDKAALAPDILVGSSRGGSLGMTYLVGGGAYNLVGPPHITVEAGLASSDVSLSYSQFSYTVQIYPVVRFK